jgi:hypothetical protein
MKLLTSINNAMQAAWYRAGLYFATLVGMLMAAPAQAINKTDLTQDTSGGKKFSDVAGNLDNATQEGATLLLSVVAVGGFVVVAISLYTLWKASKDEREKPMSAIVGLFIGGAMAGVSSIMWIMKNTVVG